ncbi:MAG: 2OG-Fe(II) oxygenase [Burkholderiaceae bacterium]
MTEAQQRGVIAARHRLAPQWQDWIAENLQRGCRESDMIQVMVDNGFDAGFAGAAIAVMRDMASRVQPGPKAAGVDGGYVCDPIRIGNASRILAADRAVDVGFVMADPNVALLENLLSADECDELIERSKGKLKRSEVVNRATGGFEVNSVRTSEGTYFARGETETIRRIEERIAALCGLPVEHGEPLQILHYGVGGEYLAHHDYFEPSDPGSAVHTRAGGQRIGTLVIYLNTVEEGGETGFPKMNLHVRARRGAAAYFEYMNQDGHLDERCLHAGVPVRRGEKWIATKWLRQSPYVQAGNE